MVFEFTEVVHSLLSWLVFKSYHTAFTVLLGLL